MDLGQLCPGDAGKSEPVVQSPCLIRASVGRRIRKSGRANRRLTFVLPVSVAIIFALLFATFHSVGQSLLILLNVPFALVGGIGELWLAD
jgi:cobalt-zinc-cadmium resistance protein CzcA